MELSEEAPSVKIALTVWTLHLSRRHQHRGLVPIRTFCSVEKYAFFTAPERMQRVYVKQTKAVILRRPTYSLEACYQTAGRLWNCRVPNYVAERHIPPIFDIRLRVATMKHFRDCSFDPRFGGVQSNRPATPPAAAREPVHRISRTFRRGWRLHRYYAINTSNHVLPQLCTKNTRTLYPLIQQCRIGVYSAADAIQGRAAIAILWRCSARGSSQQSRRRGYRHRR
jgi:hypothetical protein